MNIFELMGILGMLAGAAVGAWLGQAYGIVGVIVGGIIGGPIGLVAGVGVGLLTIMLADVETRFRKAIKRWRGGSNKDG